MLKIDKNVPFAGRRSPPNGEWHSFLETLPLMKIGDSVTVKQASNHRIALSIAKIWLKKTYSAQKIDKGKVRVFRTS
jgi:hypothetical protein